mgnify:CR=1 FL=1
MRRPATPREGGRADRDEHAKGASAGGSAHEGAVAGADEDAAQCEDDTGRRLHGREPRQQQVRLMNHRA